MKTETDTGAAAKLLFKVLIDGKSCHGGYLEWSLPKDETPGDWQEVSGGEIAACIRGLHLTDDPAAWWKPGCKIYVAEGDGDKSEAEFPHKIAFRKARLLREATDAELAVVRIFTSGIHEVKGEGSIIVAGSASVRAYDSASVRAYDSASVRAYGSASVRASGSASVRAYDSASVIAYDSASVRASGSAKVDAYGSASVRASGSASVTAYDSASVRASGSAKVDASGSASVRASGSVTVVSWTGKPGVKVTERAIWIERGDGTYYGTRATPKVHLPKKVKAKKGGAA